MRFLIFIPILCSTLLSAQKEANFWYFGNSIGLDFNSGQPKRIWDSKMAAPEGTAVMSSDAGELLFYTDGVNVWDKTHKIMPNGSDLKGHWSTTQTIIVPKPGQSDCYYIFTSDEGGYSYGLCYTEVDMRLNYGKGDVVAIQKNVYLTGPISEKITATHHQNCRDYWVVTQKLYTDTIYAYLIDKAGVSSEPVKSKTGLWVNYSIGQMKISPNGKKIAYTNWSSKNGSFGIGDFDPLTGKVKNILNLPFKNGYGLEFSPNSNFLYLAASEKSFHGIYQYQIIGNTANALLNTQKIVNNTIDFCAMQLGSDGKIYALPKYKDYVWILNEPNLPAYPNLFPTRSLPLDCRNEWGLPNFISSFFIKPYIHSTQKCHSDTVRFSFNSFFETDSIHLNFGDESPNAYTKSQNITGISHVYDKPGIYVLKLITYANKRADTLTKTLRVKEFKNLYLGNDTFICNNSPLTIGPSTDYANYNWNGFSSKKCINADTQGLYILKVKDQWGCTYSDSIFIKNIVIKSDFVMSDTALCYNGHSLMITNKSYGSLGEQFETCMDYGDGQSSINLTLPKVYDKPGLYTIKSRTKTNSGCADSSFKVISILPNPIAAFNYEITCKGQNGFELACNNTSQKFESWSWEVNSSYFSHLRNPIFEFEDTGRIKISLSVHNSHGCSDTFNARIDLNYTPIVFTANAFTPNDDEINDEFRPIMLDSIRMYRLMIFNRWGQIIFTSTRLSNYWDGKTSNGERAPVDSYSYMISTLDLRDRTKYYQGIVHLIK